MEKHRHFLLTYHVVAEVPVLSIEGTMGFAEDIYRRLQKPTDSAPEAEEIDYDLDRQLHSVDRAALLQETEEDAEKEYTMDDVLQGWTSLTIKILPCSNDLQ